jgi:hypothetical protein
MKKTFVLLLIMLLSSILIQFASAQTPQYYNYNTGGASNTFPFNIYPATGKTIQTLYLPHAFDNPSPVVPGYITKLWIRAYNAGSATYTSITIKMGLTTDVDLPAGVWYTGSMTTVYNKTNVSLTSTAGSFTGITLDTPFLYDTSKSLVVEMSQCGYSGTGISVYTTTLTGNKRHTGPYATSPPPCPHPWYNTGAFATHTGIDVAPQMPGYYNFNTIAGTNNYPFNMPAGRMCQWLYAPGEFNQPSNAPSGYITSVYFFMGGTGATNRIFTNFTIRMETTPLTSLPTGLWFSPMDTVFHRDTVTLSSSTGAWMMIPLDVPYMYRNDSSLVVEVGQCSYTPSTGQMWLCQTSRSGMRRDYSVGGCPFIYSGQDATQAHFGIYIPIPVGIHNNNGEIPSAYRLDQNYPNPFNPITIISYGLPKSSNVKLTIYDILGREVTVLVNEFKSIGNYSVEFDASELASGTYIYKIEAGEFVSSKKMALIK